jgi:dTDP-4-dehydrorhamnose 3,5-epimerase
MGTIINTKLSIEGVSIWPLKKIHDERGSVMHMLRCDSHFFEKFGEIYFSTLNKGVVKAWKYHNLMTQNITIPYGLIKLVIFDDRESSKTFGAIEELVIGQSQYSLVTIPPKLWYGFQNISSGHSIIANCTTIPYNEKEVIRCSIEDSIISYHWKTKI